MGNSIWGCVASIQTPLWQAVRPVRQVPLLCTMYYAELFWLYLQSQSRCRLCYGSLMGAFHMHKNVHTKKKKALLWPRWRKNNLHGNGHGHGPWAMAMCKFGHGYIYILNINININTYHICGGLFGLVLACACVRMARLQCSEAGSSSEFKFKCVGCRLAKGVGVGTKQHAHWRTKFAAPYPATHSFF